MDDLRIDAGRVIRQQEGCCRRDVPRLAEATAGVALRELRDVEIRTVDGLDGLVPGLRRHGARRDAVAADPLLAPASDKNPQVPVSLDVWCRRDGRWKLLSHHIAMVRTPRSS
jgi:hypothetical protein